MITLPNRKIQIVARIRKETAEPLSDLARAQGLKVGPFLAHVAEIVSKCPADKFHAATAEFQREALKR